MCNKFKFIILKFNDNKNAKLFSKGSFLENTAFLIIMKKCKYEVQCQG